MRIIALTLTAVAVSVWWHPLPVTAQFFALAALAAGCMAYWSLSKRAGKLQEKVAELDKAILPGPDQAGDDSIYPDIED